MVFLVAGAIQGEQLIRCEQNLMRFDGIGILFNSNWNRAKGNRNIWVPGENGKCSATSKDSIVRLARTIAMAQ